MKSKHRKLAIAAALQSEITGKNWRWGLVRKSFTDDRKVLRIQFEYLDTVNNTTYWFTWNPLRVDSETLQLMAHMSKNDDVEFSFKNLKTTKKIRRAIVDQICARWENSEPPLDLKRDSYNNLYGAIVQ